MRRAVIAIVGVASAIACLGSSLAVAADQAEQKTVEALYQEKASLGGHHVQLRGKIVKVNNAIMNRNFLHLRDGTGKEGSNDLTITSQDTAEVGDEVVVSGTITLDKDFGAGYTYPILLEQASVSKVGH
jgi:hypothetical protein